MARDTQEPDYSKPAPGTRRKQERKPLEKLTPEDFDAPGHYTTGTGAKPGPTEETPPGHPDIYTAMNGLDRATQARMSRDAGTMAAPQEHGQFAQGVTEQFGLPGALGMSVAIPLYQLYKAVIQNLPQGVGNATPGFGGPVNAATPASLEQLLEGYRGVGRGLQGGMGVSGTQ